MKKRKLASIQVIHDIQPIAGADKIEVVSVLGWKVVVRKGEFKRLDKCVYCEVDSIMPEREEFEFLRNKNFRIKTMRLRKQLSQGIVFSTDILSANMGRVQVFDKNTGRQLLDARPEEMSRVFSLFSLFEVDKDVTEMLGVTQFEPVIPACLSGKVKGPFPQGIPKTDEMRVQSVPEVVNELKGKAYNITVKIDGSSGTFAKVDGEIHVCSRNLSLLENEDNTFWKMFYKYNMQSVFAAEGDVAIQGEIAGPSIQKNPLLLKDHELFVFNVLVKKDGVFEQLDYCELSEFCNIYNLPMVPILEFKLSFNHTVESLLELAKGKYDSGKRREGIVIRPNVQMYSETLSGRLSFKAINNDFLLKDED